MNNEREWRELIDRHLRGELNEPEQERLAELLDQSPRARREFVEHAQWDVWFSEALREPRDARLEYDLLIKEQSPTPGEPAPKHSFQLLMLTAAVVVIAALSAGLVYQRADNERRIEEITKVSRPSVSDPPIARVTGLSGPLTWTGDRGRITRELAVGTELAGGTIEGMAPDSWFELEFNDGSTVMIAGASMLTFSELGQKELRLKSGVLSADVRPQPDDKPMLIHTRSALVKVLGTRFEVEAGLSSTVVSVSEGSVRFQRLSDGNTVDVPANHRAVAAADRDMSPAQTPKSVNRWRSRLQVGPAAAYGKWLPATDRRPASLKAIPFVPRENKSVTLYLLGLPVARSDNSPVVVKPNSNFIVRGRLATSADVFFGIRMAHPNGEFAGKFRARQKAMAVDDQGDFEATYPLGDFALDPCVRDRKDEFPARPDGLIVTGVWCFTHAGFPTGLEVTEVELTPPADP
ncbi:MAG: FecR family protein [Planctomycetales bacterium]